MTALAGLPFFIHTFGCQMNELDSERIAGSLAAAGARKVEELEASRLVIVNTCAVRSKSEDKLYSYLGRLRAWKRRRDGLVAVVGCVSQIDRERILSRCPAVDIVAGPDNYHRLAEVLAEGLQRRTVMVSRVSGWREDLRGPVLRESPVSAYVTIMEGCDNFCAYCIVPFARGRARFRPLSAIVEETGRLAADGYREVQLLGQNVNAYRDPETGATFADLLTRVDRVEGAGWVRFVTSHPRDLDNPTIAAMAASRHVCRQIHLPLQAGSTAVLSRMKRGYAREDYLDRVGRLRAAMPGIALSTDIIVGFPGETEAEFAETLTALEEIRFASIFSFMYSPRPRTAAALLADDVPPEVKRRRLREVQALQEGLQTALHQEMIGRTVDVLGLDRNPRDPGLQSGRTEGNQVVNFRSGRECLGRFVPVEIIAAGPYSLHGLHHP
jgi:tRNA-2-methylthio-N6-dimethylallyladenosine synthase